MGRLTSSRDPQARPTRGGLAGRSCQVLAGRLGSHVPALHVFSRGAAWQILPSGMWPHWARQQDLAPPRLELRLRPICSFRSRCSTPERSCDGGGQCRRPAPAGMPRCTSVVIVRRRIKRSARRRRPGCRPDCWNGVAAYFWLMSRHQKSFQQPFGVGRFASSPFRHAGPARISPRMGPLGGDPPGNAHGDRQLPAPRAHQPLRKRRPCGHPAGLPSQHKPDP